MYWAFSKCNCAKLWVTYAYTLHKRWVMPWWWTLEDWAAPPTHNVSVSTRNSPWETLAPVSRSAVDWKPCDSVASESRHTTPLHSKHKHTHTPCNSHSCNNGNFCCPRGSDGLYCVRRVVFFFSATTITHEPLHLYLDEILHARTCTSITSRIV